MKKFISILLCVFLTLMVGCSGSLLENAINSNNSNQSNDLKLEHEIIKSKNGVFQAEIPKEWYDISDLEYDLKAGDKGDTMLFLALMERKVDFATDLGGYNDLVVENDEIAHNITIEQSIPTTIGDYKAYLNEFDFVEDSIRYHMWVYAIETDNYYGQVTITALKSMADENNDELMNIVNSFKENV